MTRHEGRAHEGYDLGGNRHLERQPSSHSHSSASSGIRLLCDLVVVLLIWTKRLKDGGRGAYTWRSGARS